ncbi:MAG: F0F1 ATP synthase subunit A [Heliobacteriaceae bacterium]|nr:F0F1 ATP synthase subunit A [Heliobacteriaceae bacterium]
MEHWVYSLNIAGYTVNMNMDTLITMWFSMLLLIILAFATSRNISVIPNKLQIAGEGIINYLVDIIKSGMGEQKAMQHSPLLLTLFFFILTANLAGQLPWHLIHLHHGELASPNNDINMTAAMAAVVSVYYIYYGLKQNGLKFFFHGFNLDGIIISLIDLLEHFVRPFSLALRLFANILAGEMLVFAFLGICTYIVPMPFMLFELFVALIQALVFTLLSTSYISMSISEEH